MWKKYVEILWFFGIMLMLVQIRERMNKVDKVRETLLGMTVNQNTETGHYVALTFDDGPHAVCTPVLLEGLKQRGVQATFFLLGESIAGKESIIKQMKEDGHLIGNHTYRHVQLTNANRQEVCDSVKRTNDLIEHITGSKPEYIRPPFGAWNDQLDCTLSMTKVLWSVDSEDWKLRNKDRIVKKVLFEVGDGDIILMHDIFPESVQAALEVVDELKKRGYTFVTVDEMLIE